MPVPEPKPGNTTSGVALSSVVDVVYLMECMVAGSGLDCDCSSHGVSATFLVMVRVVVEGKEWNWRCVRRVFHHRIPWERMSVSASKACCWGVGVLPMVLWR